jgi:hypothetical protein
MVKKITKLLLLTTIVFALTLNIISATTVIHSGTDDTINTYIEDSTGPSPGFEYESTIEMDGSIYVARRDVFSYTTGGVLADNFVVEDRWGYVDGSAKIHTTMDSDSVHVNDCFYSGGGLGVGFQRTTNDVTPWPSETNIAFERGAAVWRGGTVSITHYETDINFGPFGAETLFASGVGSTGVSLYGQRATYGWWGASQDTTIIVPSGCYIIGYGMVDLRGSPDYGYGFAAVGDAGGFGDGDYAFVHVEANAYPQFFFLPDSMSVKLDYVAEGDGLWSGSLAYGETVLLGGSSSTIWPGHREQHDNYFWGW